MDKKFKVTIPAMLEKSEEGDWRVYGLASTSNRDQQGEVVDVKGLDISPIEKGRGVFNFDHQRGPENTVGVIDTWEKGKEGLHLGGYLFKNHDKAKALHGIMSSLKKSDRGRVGMSVEGVIKERKGSDSKTISKAVIKACAITLNPVNSDTYADLVKSLGIDNINNDDEFTLTNDEIEMPTEDLEKALGVGAGYAESAPKDLSGGDALAKEDLDKKVKKTDGICKMCKADMCKCKKSLPKKSSDFYKSYIVDIMDNLQRLYPDASRSEIWETVKDRLNTRFNLENNQ